MLQVVTINFLVFRRLKRLSHWGDFWNSFHLLSFFLEMFFENHVLCTLVVPRGGWTCLAILGCAWAYFGVVLLHLVLHRGSWTYWEVEYPNLSLKTFSTMSYWIRQWMQQWIRFKTKLSFFIWIFTSLNMSCLDLYQKAKKTLVFMATRP